MQFITRNEVRADGITLPTWGSGDALTDWSIAAVKGAKEVLQEKPDLLIVVSGALQCMIMHGFMSLHVILRNSLPKEFTSGCACLKYQAAPSTTRRDAA